MRRFPTLFESGFGRDQTALRGNASTQWRSLIGYSLASQYRERARKFSATDIRLAAPQWARAGSLGSKCRGTLRARAPLCRTVLRPGLPAREDVRARASLARLRFPRRRRALLILRWQRASAR